MSHQHSRRDRLQQANDEFTDEGILHCHQKKYPPNRLLITTH